MLLSEQLTLSIVSHGHGSIMENLVRQLDAIPNLLDVTLILTLNQSEEPCIFERVPTINLKVLILRNTNPKGFGENHNNAFRMSQTSWFGILNPDLIISEDIFSGMIETAIQRKASLIAPRIVNTDGGQEDSVRNNLTPLSLLKRRFSCFQHEKIDTGQFRWLAGMFYLISDEAFEDVNGFDERFFLYCEDYDLCARMSLAGHLILFQPHIKIIHDARRASHKSWKFMMMHIKSLLQVWMSYPVWRIALRDFRRLR